MQPKHLVLIAFLILTTLLGGAVVVQSSAPPHEATYVEPSLRSHEAKTLSVIVTAADSQTAAEVVERVGGQVSSDLWLIDAVGASLPAGQLEALATEPGVISIVDNKGVGTASDPPDRPGWVTDRREKKNRLPPEGKQFFPAVFLPDGGFVSVTEIIQGKAKTNVIVYNADGSERMRVGPVNGQFRSAPVVDAAGNFYLAGGDGLIYGFDSNGLVGTPHVNR